MVALRKPGRGDLDFLYGLELLPEVQRVTLGDARITRHMLWQYISEGSGDLGADGQLRLVVDVDGVAVGTVDIADYDARNGRAMVGIAIDRPYRRGGYGRAALGQLIDMCRDSGMCQLCAIVPHDNAASLALFEGCGFVAAGLLRRWLRRGAGYADAVILQLLL